MCLLRTTVLCEKFVNPHFHLFGYECAGSLNVTGEVSTKVTLGCDLTLHRPKGSPKCGKLTLQSVHPALSGV